MSSVILETEKLSSLFTKKVKVPSAFLSKPDPSADPPKTKFGLAGKTSSEVIKENNSKFSNPACFFNKTELRIDLLIQRQFL